MSNLFSHPHKNNDEQEVKNVYNALPQTLLDSFGKRALKDAKSLINKETNNLNEDDMADIAFSIYRAYVLGAILEKSNKDDIHFNEEPNENKDIKRSIRKSDDSNVLHLIVDRH